MSRMASSSQDDDAGVIVSIDGGLDAELTPIQWVDPTGFGYPTVFLIGHLTGRGATRHGV